MGYRSDVGVAIYPGIGTDSEMCEELYNKLKLLLATTYKKVMDEYFGNDATFDDVDKQVTFHIRDVKWYDSYPDVQAFMQMLNELGDGDLGNYGVEFVRMGEDYDDIDRQEWGDTSYRVDVRRELEFN